MELISRQAAQHKINALIDEFEIIMKDIRERHVDDSVCGLCEYDGAFMSNSGDWCNECPGFERDDCFKLKDQYREEWAGAIENLPPVQPTITHEQAIDYLHKTGWLQNHDRILTESKVPLKGTWKDFTDEGYVECPFCKSATNCESKEEINDLHFCFSCGAMLKKGEADGHN